MNPGHVVDQRVKVRFVHYGNKLVDIRSVKLQTVNKCIVPKDGNQ